MQGRSDTTPTLIVSEKQSYKIHAFGHAEGDFVAIWRTIAEPKIAKITLEERQWRNCSFRWQDGTPPAEESGILVEFPDGRIEIRHADEKTSIRIGSTSRLPIRLAFRAIAKPSSNPGALGCRRPKR